MLKKIIYSLSLSFLYLLSLSCSGSGGSASLSSVVSVTSLGLSQGLLNPAFSPTINSYSVDLKHRFDQISFNFQSSENSSFQVNGSAVAGSYPLTVGANSFTIVVSAQDSSAQRTINVMINRGRQFVYVSNVNTSSPSDTLSMYSINPTTGQLEALSPGSLSVGDDPYDLLVSPLGNYLYVANAGDNTISQYTINFTTGALSALSPVTVATGSTPYAMIIPSNEQNFYIPMGGSSGPGDIYQYQMGSQGALTPLSPNIINSGNNPWFMAITPNDQYAYCSIFNGFGDSNPDTIEMFSRDPITGLLSSLSPASVATGDKPWHINVHPNGNYVYNVNYGSGTVTGYAVNASTGQLSALAGSPFSVGASPIGLAIDPQGRFLYVANNGNNTVSMFTVETSGALTVIGGGTIAVTTPYGLEVDHTGRFLYVSSNNSNAVAMFAIDQGTGALTALGTPTIATGTNPRFIRISH